MRKHLDDWGTWVAATGLLCELEDLAGLRFDDKAREVKTLRDLIAMVGARLSPQADGASDTAALVDRAIERMRRQDWLSGPWPGGAGGLATLDLDAPLVDVFDPDRSNTWPSSSAVD